MNKNFLVALLMIAFCLPTGAKIQFPGLAQSYILVDQIMMQIYQPAIRLAVFSWARKASCDYLYPKLITYLSKTMTIDELTNNSLDTQTTSSICNKGIDMYFENYYTLGNADLPWATTFTWAGTPSD